MTYENDYQVTTWINPGIFIWKLNKEHMDLLWSYVRDSSERGGWVLDDNNKVVERDNFQEWSLQDKTGKFETYNAQVQGIDPDKDVAVLFVPEAAKMKAQNKKLKLFVKCVKAMVL